MSDKDLLVVISEMRRKQDQQAEKLDLHSTILNHHSEILNQHTEILNEHTVYLKQTNESLNNFVEISIQEFAQQRQQNQQQQQFNAQFLDTLKELNDNFADSKEQQNQFNERFLNKPGDIEKALKK